MIAEPPLDAPDEDWLVWADAMQQIGDPRGELLALGHRASYVKEHAEALLGRELGRHVRKGDIVVTKWRRYLADEIELRVEDAREGPKLVVDALRTLPHLRGLAIAGIGDVDLTATLGWLRDSKLPPSLTGLALIDDRARSVPYLVSRDFEPGPNRVVFGPLYPLWVAFAQLERLTMIVADPGQIQFQTLRLPNLRELTLRSLVWAEGLGDILANTRLPKLRALELRLPESYLQNNPTDERAYASVYKNDRERDPIDLHNRPRETPWREDLVRLEEWWRDMPLERLALTSWANPIVLDVLDQLPPTVVELDFSDSAFDRREAERLANHHVALQLKRLVIERVRLLSPKTFDGLGIEVVHSCKPAAPIYRYITGME